jgi:hypothetical protein
MPTPTDLVTDLPADFEVFGQAVDTSLADLKGGTSGQVLAKNSNTDMDFVWVAQDDSNAIQNAIVDAKGDLIAASANDTPARLAVGNNGETLVADSSTSTGLRYTKMQPNYAINGAFDFWQRGTSFTVTGILAYTADRFFCYAAGANATAARSTSVPTGSIAPYSLELTGAASQTLLEISQRTESQYMNALKTTVTFSARIFNNTGAAFTPSIYIQSPTGVDNWAGVTTNVNNVALQSCPDNAWTTIYYTADWSGYTNISNGVGVLLEFGAAANGAAKKIRITEWQVTPTAMIMPFQRSAATLQGELAACQRYYQKSYAQGTTVPTNTSTSYTFTPYPANAGNGETFAYVPLPVIMRVAPTVTVYSYTSSSTGRVSGASGGDLAANSGTVTNNTDRGFSVYNNSGGTINYASGGFIFHWAASGEL